MSGLDPSFLSRPLAHRGLHDAGAARPENSLSALRAAVEAGYGAEIDVQISADGQAMVFHDATLDRMTMQAGPLDRHDARDLGQMILRGSVEPIPTLAQALRLVAGRVPLLVEIKDRDGALGEDVGPLERAVAAALDGYEGPVAVMSFNPHSVAAMAREAPAIPRGLTTASFDAGGWPGLPAAARERLRGIRDFDTAGAAFISHEAADLDRPRVAELREAGAAVLCWTIRDAAQAAAALRRADNITFEGFLP